MWPSHITPEMVAHRWAITQERDAEVSVRLCRVCGAIITGWRLRPGHRPEPLEGGLLHACPPRKWRNYWHRQGRRERRERVTGSSHQTQAGGILYIVGLGHQGRRQPPC